MDLERRRSAVIERLERCRSVVVALSGGVDSAVLLALSVEALGARRVLAATARSPSLPATELADARETAAGLGVRHEVVDTRELDRSGYRANAGDRCFHCRAELFAALGDLASRRGLRTVVYGAIADDLDDHRPGMRAAEQSGAVAPLLEAGLAKADVRALAEAARLAVSRKPANACLASRIPVGVEVTPARLASVERAEAALRRLGLGRLRVRHHGDVARLELEAGTAGVLCDPALRSGVVEAIRSAGFRFVALDLEGYRSGSVSGPGPSGTGASTATPDGPTRARREPDRSGGCPG